MKMQDPSESAYDFTVWQPTLHVLLMYVMNVVIYPLRVMNVRQSRNLPVQHNPASRRCTSDAL